MKKIIILNALFILLLLIVNFLYLSSLENCTCIHNVNPVEEHLETNSNSPEEWLKEARNGVYHGDRQLYGHGAIMYMNYISGVNVFYYSVVMAFQHEWEQAYWHVHFILKYPFMNSYKEKISDHLNNFMLYNLAKSHELGHKLSTLDLKQLTDKNGKILHSNYFLDQMKVKE